MRAAICSILLREINNIFRILAGISSGFGIYLVRFGYIRNLLRRPNNVLLSLSVYFRLYVIHYILHYPIFLFLFIHQFLTLSGLEFRPRLPIILSQIIILMYKRSSSWCRTLVKYIQSIFTSTLYQSSNLFCEILRNSL